MTIDWLGYFAASLTTIAFFPQAYLIYKTKRVENLSLGLFSLFTIGVFSWLLYGVLILNYPIIIANGLTLAQAGYILTMIIKYKPDVKK